MRIIVAKKSKTLRTMLEYLGVKEDATEDNEFKEILPLINQFFFGTVFTNYSCIQRAAKTIG